MTGKFDQQYAAFLDWVDSGTPETAMKNLELFGASEDLLQQIAERHEQEVRKVKEREEPRTVVLDNRFTWYTGPRAKDKCWPALEETLKKSGWSDKSLDDLDGASTKVVSLLSHPQTRAFSTKGLVVGYVQSGKTTNFTAVTAKAADRGYKLFIVLAGIHNGLRRQTQRRLVQQLVKPNPSRWLQLTDPDKDFTPPANAAAYLAKNNKQHILCVIKKNPRVLEKFSAWLETAAEYLADCPALIIDDEADQATVATATINPLICEILGRLPKSAYVGYTATPFANLLIDPSAKDLYPKHFIVNLPKPQGHFGTEVLFGRDVIDGEDPEDVFDGYDMIREVPRSEVELVRPGSRAEMDGFRPEITGSLRTAILYFWVCTAARRVRNKGNPHSTMLVHTSVNTSVHNSFEQPLEKFRDATETLVRSGDGELSAELRKIWEHESARVRAEDFHEKKVTFDELESLLPGVLHDCRIVMDNSGSKDRLDYENGPVVAIAVGGNTLSRGLTLEGLAVSFFVRSVSAYDTLLQMGRWFGFRNGYADLPRIWMTNELRDWFRHIATVETEMRRDIDVYMVEDKTPMTFAVRLRTHPALRVTAAAKMTNAVPSASAYGGQRVQTRYFRTDREWLTGNQAAARTLIDKAALEGRTDKSVKDGNKLIRNVPHDIVTEFLRDYSFDERSQECDSKLLTEYIARRIARSGALRSWNVAIIGGSAGDEAPKLFSFANEFTVRMVTRSALDAEDAGRVDIKTLMSRRDAAIDLDVSSVKGELTEKMIKELRAHQSPGTALLALYAIDKDSTPLDRRADHRRPLNAAEDVIGVGLVLPEPTSDDSAVEWNSVSTNLANVHIEDEDLSALHTVDD
ncbi:Z1 domain-containing protein [Amycolatopsis sp. PS_44_ISF1]|uniref:Z1 domain-containing protein n=1 Tax=Amycolatopsis sp. PS_44_ISF1 TaxID=2974917 RepID=UPI0028DD5461|nr:Z1 domain-containing protein [Amycolatopsis sp. PS_44_ISF1]MDT8910555.1 Z1 domain-containing protein [Amycolatopsis sp. PS_44_ISF1]